MLSQPQDLEILLFDDCGNDGSLAIAQAYAARYPDRIRVFAGEQNLGAGARRDEGIRAALGEYLTFADADDTLPPGYFDSLTAPLAGGARPDLIAAGHLLIRKGRSKAVIPDPSDPSDPWMHPGCWGKLYRTAYLREKNIDFRGCRVYEDGLFLYRLLASRPETVILPEALYRYELNDDSVTRKKSRSRIRLFPVYAAEILDLAREISVLPEDREILVYCLACQLTVNLLYNGQGGGLSRMRRCVAIYEKTLREAVPDIVGNRYVSLRIPRGEPLLEKLAAFTILKLRPVGAHRLLLGLVSVLPKIR